jgi:cytoskeletal protein CcmA (bactofilin family)
MNVIEIRKRASAVAVVFAAFALLAVPASARHFNFGKMNHQDVPHVDIHVAKGETMADEIATSGSVLIEGKATDNVAVFGGPVTIDGTVIGDVAAFGGPVIVNGSVKGDVASFGGPVTINGDVMGEVAATGGDVTLGPKASIHGDLALLGGKLLKADGAKVSGSISNFDLKIAAKLAPMAAHWRGWEHATHDQGEDESAGGRLALFAGFAVFTACIGLVVAVLAALLPQPVEQVAQSVKGDFWGTAGAGVLVTLGFFPSLLLLVVSILGIPLIPLAFITATAAVVLGLAAASRLAGERLFESLKKPQPGSAVVAALYGYGVLIGLLFVGKVLRLAGGLTAFAGGSLVLAGLMIVCAAVILGLGGVWRTRMGTRAA